MTVGGGVEKLRGDWDAQLFVRGDIAVVWRTAPCAGGWERRTKVFRKQGSSWKLVHAQVTFPYEAGEAAFSAAA
jgi:ketosteroid isomerase-like protein